jgi:L-aspartate oxidase
VTVASALVAAAACRAETRGSHWREDHPDPDERWLGHLDLRLDPDGTIHTEYTAADTRQRGTVR